jgi:hypothetical protein
MLAYPTVVLSIGWYPWNALLLLPLFKRRFSRAGSLGHRAKDAFWH